MCKNGSNNQFKIKVLKNETILIKGTAVNLKKKIYKKMYMKIF